MTSSESRDKAVYDQLVNGQTLSVIARQIGLSRQRVSQLANRYRKKHGLPHWAQDPTGGPQYRRRRPPPVVDIDALRGWRDMES